MPTPEPDEHGRYRVRRKGDTQSAAWSTRQFDPEQHVIVSGPASDTYGNAWPTKPHRRFVVDVPAQNEDSQDADPDSNTTATPDEESKS